MSKLDVFEKKSKLLIFVVFILSLLILSIYYYNVGKKKYATEVQKEFRGIITAKFRNQDNNSKSYRIKVNDTISYDIPFVLIDQIVIGDTVIKEKNKDFYMYYTKNTIIKVLVPIPTILGYPKDKREDGEIRVR